MRRTRRCLNVIWFLASATLLLASGAGCAGGGRLDFISLDYGNIDPPAPRPSTLKLSRGYWWTGEHDELWLSLEAVARPLAGAAGNATFQLSLRLERMPAGEARDYRINSQSLRAVAQFGPLESRFTSRRGILALYREKDGRLRGSLRISAQREDRRMLGGWTQPTPMLLLGQFVAVPDEEAGRPIAEKTESAGWERDAIPVPTPFDH